MENQDQALLIALLETAVDAIIVIDAEGIIRKVNPSTTRLFGYDQSELIGENVKLLMPSPYREQHDGYLKNYHETGHAKIIGTGREVTGQRKDKSTFPMHLAVSKMPMGDQMMFAGIVRDISHLKEAERQLARTNEHLENRIREATAELNAAQAELLISERMATLGQVSGGIAHEIRNPLNAIRTSVYYLSHAKSPNPEKITEHLQRIDRQVSMIDNVITALSDIAKLPDPAASTCDMVSLLVSVAETVELPLHTTVKFDLPTDGFRATVDPNQLSIVFGNLIRNACDAMPDGGVITISGKYRDGELCIKVSDTGIGIREVDLGKVAEPLFSTKARGMGLGLSISVAILKKNRGRLEVDSTFGEGAAFSVYLKPASEDSGQ